MDASWDLCGGSWGPLGLSGGSRGPHGTMLEPLGAVLGPLGMLLSVMLLQIDLNKSGPILYDLFEVPKGCQEGTKMELNKSGPNSKQKSKMKRTVHWDRVWIVFGSFWCQYMGETWLNFVSFYTVFVTDDGIMVLNDIMFRATFLLDFGLVLVLKWSPSDIQNASKTASKSRSEMNGCLIDFWSSPEAMTHTHWPGRRRSKRREGPSKASS